MAEYALKPKRNAEYLNWKDHIMSGLQPAEERAQYLQNRADLNKAADDARIEAEKQAREMSKKRRRDMGE